MEIMAASVQEGASLFLLFCHEITTIPHITLSESERIMDRLDELAVLVTIIDEGSLAAAARRLRRSSPSITRVLAALEERAGARLLERTTAHLAPVRC